MSDGPVDELYDDWMNRVVSEQAGDINQLRADLASARAANKAMYERINRLELDAEAREERHRETIRTLRLELAGVMPDE
jgi:hypothetical protein